MQHLKFIHKLHSILSRPELQEWIFWSKQDSSVFVVKPYDPKFSSQVLKKYFKHGNVSSFVRQLHMYGFHKISSNHNGDNITLVNKADIKWSFTHPSGYFHKNAYSLTLNNIQRKRTGLGKDGKRKNILSPVSVNFIHPSNQRQQQQQQLPNDPMSINQNGRNMIPPNIPSVGSYLMAPGQSIEHHETQQQQQQIMNGKRLIVNNCNSNGYTTAEENMAGSNNGGGMPGSIYIVDPYQNVANPTIDINENRPMNYQGQPVTRNPVLTNSQVVPYPPAIPMEQPNTFRQYYQPTSYSVDLQQPRQMGTTTTLPPYLNYPKNGGLSHGPTHMKSLVGYSSTSDHHGYETGSNTSGKKRESITISDINNVTTDRISDSPLVSHQNIKLVPPLSITHSLTDKTANTPIFTSSSTDTIGTIIPPSRLPLAEMEEYKIYREVCDGKLKNLDNNMAVVIKSILEVRERVDFLSQQQDTSSPKKKKKGISDIKEENRNSTKSLEKLFEKNIPITLEELDRLNEFLNDMNSLFNKYEDLLK
ncbi:similar to Saccharomyces cerevisiae YGR249W MGA1 Protein similar to heat shock transcription factor [Maudiozyma barnettii]|uniref:Similar to Saccharomyces cerevisiae YGR249W MGA1 Protein similar to heat shock transcription factor n=1 Tax=Maudiozyma barnettii TaxID=61262 RepID=A0A8H2VI84_9SACH|nr:Mga1p [Kazachstania barnettii]CAB4256129.1 similar to Saccharomyces cerevisiae YGR249W MGA1 Protein similar to heat shock transcription factor [Kazachstania barnettii]CAD1784737.1 similar to Saccharomyces cerevisiae YGR249W MGA1 Protein similar to heat shock transcription factor [Kazachstania barnettii]